MSTTKHYSVFHRTWWAENPRWPNGLEPKLGEKHYLGYDLSWPEAREMCDDWNAEHEPGRLSDKAEFEED